MEQLLFKRAMEALWTNFLREVRKTKTLSNLYLDKFHYLHDDTVYPDEARRMIVRYWQAYVTAFADCLFKTFTPKELKDTHSEQEIRSEFFIIGAHA